MNLLAVENLTNLDRSKFIERVNNSLNMVNLENMTDVLIKNNPSELAHVIKISPPVKEKSYFLMLSHGFYKSQPELSNAIWNEIKNIKDSGDYQRILNTY